MVNELDDKKRENINGADTNLSLSNLGCKVWRQVIAAAATANFGRLGWIAGGFFQRHFERLVCSQV